MRRIALLAAFILPLTVLAQSKADYEKAMQRFKDNYNRGNAKGIRAMFSDSWGETKKSLWPQQQLDNLVKGYGRIQSYTYVTVDTVSDDNRLTLFKVVCERKTFMTSFDLDKAKKFGTFRFNTSSPFIDKLLE